MSPGGIAEYSATIALFCKSDQSLVVAAFQQSCQAGKDLGHASNSADKQNTGRAYAPGLYCDAKWSLLGAIHEPSM